MVPLLKILGNSKKNEHVLYDPYYCDGAVKRNLQQLGFPNVHHVKEDCYDVWKRGTLPAFDVLVTNPPYSSAHVRKVEGFSIVFSP